MQGVSHKENDLFYYQGKEKPEDGSLWDQFELRLYNHDLGRWFAPDPYGQFYSPYVGMGNNPASNTDPDGGYVIQAGHERHFYGKDKMDEDKALGRGHWSSENLTREYEQRYEELAKKYGVGSSYSGGSGNGTASMMGDVEGYLSAVRLLNNEFQGLGLAGQTLENGSSQMNQAEAANYLSEIMYTNGTVGGPESDGGNLNNWDKGPGSVSIIPSVDDAIMSTANGYDMQEQDKILTLSKIGGYESEGLSFEYNYDLGIPTANTKYGYFILNGSIDKFFQVIYNNAKLSLINGSGYKELSGYALEKGGKNFYFINSQSGNSETHSNGYYGYVEGLGFDILFSLHSHSALGDVSEADYNSQRRIGAEVYSIDPYGDIYKTNAGGLDKDGMYGWLSGYTINDYKSFFMNEYGIKK